MVSLSLEDLQAHGNKTHTLQDGLRAYFTQYGDIDQCTIMRDPTGRSRGFAFLTFKDPASVQIVLDRDHQLDGKMVRPDAIGEARCFCVSTYVNAYALIQIDPKRAIPRAEHERTAKVFVGGLAPSVTSDKLKRFLAQFGKVMDATVMFDRINGRSKGFAFATFADESGVDEAMKHSGIELEGRQVSHAMVGSDRRVSHHCDSYLIFFAYVVPKLVSVACSDVTPHPPPSTNTTVLTPQIEIKKAQPRGAGTQVKSFNAPGGARTSSFNATPGMGFGMPGFDPSAMAMMYQNMLKASGGGGGAAMAGGMGSGGGGFDPNSMAMMYQNMMKSECGVQTHLAWLTSRRHGHEPGTSD